MADHKTISGDDCRAVSQPLFKASAPRLRSYPESGFALQDRLRRDLVLIAKIGRRRALEHLATRRRLHQTPPRPDYIC